MLPSGERASLVLFGSLKYSNGVAVLNQTVPGVPAGHAFMDSSRIRRSPSSTLPTVPRCASHCPLSHAANPTLPLAADYSLLTPPRPPRLSASTAPLPAAP